jgi:hypothetical protein
MFILLQETIVKFKVFSIHDILGILFVFGDLLVLIEGTSIILVIFIVVELLLLLLLHHQMFQSSFLVVVVAARKVGTGTVENLDLRLGGGGLPHARY